MADILAQTRKADGFGASNFPKVAPFLCKKQPLKCLFSSKDCPREKCASQVIITYRCYDVTSSQWMLRSFLKNNLQRGLSRATLERLKEAFLRHGFLILTYFLQPSPKLARTWEGGASAFHRNSKTSMTRNKGIWYFSMRHKASYEGAYTSDCSFDKCSKYSLFSYHHQQARKHINARASKHCLNACWITSSFN